MEGQITGNSGKFRFRTKKVGNAAFFSVASSNIINDVTLEQKLKDERGAKIESCSKFPTLLSNAPVLEAFDCDRVDSKDTNLLTDP